MLSSATVAAVALAADGGVAPRLFELLVLHFGSPEAVVAASSDRLAQVPQVSTAQAEAIRKAAARLDDVRARLEQLEGRGIRVISFFDDAYPEAMRRIADPPSFFYLRGGLGPAARCLAVVGNPGAGADAIAEAVAVGKRLGALGVGVVAGLEEGIDAGAHIGALAAGGASLAVLSSGLDRVEPAEHSLLADQIAARGGVLSCHSPDARATRARAADSARVICALGQAAVLIAPDGDAAHLTRLTESILNMGKPVFVLAHDRTPTVASLLSLGAYPLLDPGEIEAALAYI